MVATTLQKAMVIYIVFSVFLFVGGVRLVGDDAENIVGQFVTIENTSEIGGAGFEDNVNPSSLYTATLPREFNNPVQTESLTFIDSLGASQNFVSFIINLLFAPFSLMKGAGLSANIIILVVIPFSLILFLGMAYFIRSGA